MSTPPLTSTAASTAAPRITAPDVTMPRITKGYVDSPEGQMHYRQAGEGPPVVLIHQGPGSSAMWTALLPQLASLGWHAVAFDLPGLGLSDPGQLVLMPIERSVGPITPARCAHFACQRWPSPGGGNSSMRQREPQLPHQTSFDFMS